MEQKYIDKLTDQIIDYLSEGGELYDINVKNLPFYEGVNYLCRHSNGMLKSFGEALNFLGFEYDPEYHEYEKLIGTLECYADENGYVDEMKNHRGEGVDTSLKEFAKALSCTPSDYLLLMTDYRYKNNASKRANYVEELISRIYKFYPDGNITNFRHNHPELYNSIRNVLLQAHSESASMEDLSYLLGVYLSDESSHHFSDKQIYQNVKESQVVREYEQEFAEGKIKNLSTDNPTLYRKIYICAIKNNLPVYEWFKMHNLTPPNQTNKNTYRLGRIKVDPAEREFEIKTKMQEIISREHSPIPNNKIDQYYFRKELAKKVLNELSNHSSKQPLSSPNAIQPGEDE